jgi:tRNA nucleotidyltransferase (CCA-adding enzyme)
MACALTPYRGITYVDEKAKVHPAVEAVIREGLKVGTKNHYLDGVPALFSASELFKSPDIEDEKVKSPSERVAIGLLLRQNSVHNAHVGAHWTTSLLFSLIQELVDYYDPSKDHFNVDDAAKVIEKYNRFAKRVDELGLQGDVDAKPILDGREIVRILGAQKPGQWTGKVLAEVIKWQLGHPGETKEQCAEWLKEELVAGRLSIEDVASSTITQTRRQRDGPKETATKKTRT